MNRPVSYRDIAPRWIARMIGLWAIGLAGAGVFGVETAAAQAFSNQCFQAPWRFGCPGYVPGSGFSGLDRPGEPVGRRCAASPGSPGCEIYRPSTGVNPLDALPDQKRALRRFEKEEGAIEPGLADRRDQRRRGLRDDEEDEVNGAQNPARRDLERRETGDPDPREASRDPRAPLDLRDRRVGPDGRELREGDRGDRDRSRAGRDDRAREADRAAPGRIDRTERVGGIPRPQNEFGRFDRDDRTRRGRTERRNQDSIDTRAWGDAR